MFDHRGVRWAITLPKPLDLARSSSPVVVSGASRSASRQLRRHTYVRSLSWARERQQPRVADSCRCSRSASYRASTPTCSSSLCFPRRTRSSASSAARRRATRLSLRSPEPSSDVGSGVPERACEKAKMQRSSVGSVGQVSGSDFSKALTILFFSLPKEVRSPGLDALTDSSNRPPILPPFFLSLPLGARRVSVETPPPREDFGGVAGRAGGGGGDLLPAPA